MNIRSFADIKSLFLDNKTLKQTIFKNTFWLAIAEGTSQFLKLILIIYVARILGATDYGKFTFALAFVSLFVIFSDFGLSRITTRELAREKEGEKEFASILSLKILLSAGVLMLILTSSFFVTHDHIIHWAIWILAIYVLINNFFEILYAFLRAYQKMQYEAWIKILQALAISGIGFFIILNFPSVKNLSYSYLVASLAILIFALFFFHFRIYHLHLSWDRKVWKKFLSMSWPLAGGGVFAIICIQIDSVMMGYWGQITETGWYNAAYKIINGTLVPMTIISTAIYPALSKSFRKPKEEFQNVWNYYAKLIIFLAVPLVIGGIVFAPRIIDFIYGPEFSPSILAFQILIVMAGIMFLNNPLNQALIVFNQQKKTFWIGLTSAVVNIVLNIILIPKFSLYGAAIASLITFLLIFFLLLISALKFTPIRPFNLILLSALVIAIFSSGVMYFMMSRKAILHFNILLVILISAVVYSVSFFIIQKISNKTCKINRRKQI